MLLFVSFKTDALVMGRRFSGILRLCKLSYSGSGKKMPEVSSASEMPGQ